MCCHKKSCLLPCTLLPLTLLPLTLLALILLPLTLLPLILLPLILLLLILLPLTFYYLFYIAFSVDATARNCVQYFHYINLKLYKLYLMSGPNMRRNLRVYAFYIEHRGFQIVISKTFRRFQVLLQFLGLRF